MLFVIGEMLLLFAIIYFFVVLLAVRNPKMKSNFFSSGMVESFHVFMFMMPIIVGPSLIIKGFDDFKTIGIHTILSIALLVLAVFIFKKLNIKKRLAEFDALAKQMNSPTDNPTSPPKDISPGRRVA